MNSSTPDIRNLAWANDQSGFGFKMLNKMGWSQGKGLGANESGIVENIRLKRKVDNRGIGSRDAGDTWMMHTRSFQKVLASLNNTKMDSELQPTMSTLANATNEETTSTNKNLDCVNGDDMIGGLDGDKKTETLNMKTNSSSDTKQVKKRKRSKEEKEKRKKVKKKKDRDRGKKKAGVHSAIDKGRMFHSFANRRRAKDARKYGKKALDEILGWSREPG